MRQKMYFGVSSMNRSSMFYFNLYEVGTIKFSYVSKKSKAWEGYLEYCDEWSLIPCRRAYFLNVGFKGGKESFLISDKKMKQLVKRMKGLLINLDDVDEFGEEE